VARILREIDYSKPVNLDIGSGFAPTPNCYHIDIREDLPEIDIICDISKEALPIKDASVNCIISNHSIEHVKWPLVKFVTDEWSRVLMKDGAALIRTPNLEFIIDRYLKARTTDEWPDDEKRAMEIFGSITPAVWANIKLFAGQDYEGNVHYMCFDFRMLEALLLRSGFSRVHQVDLGDEFSPGELQVRAVK